MCWRSFAVELTAQADKAVPRWRRQPQSQHVYAGVVREQSILKAAIAKARARLDYVQAQLTRTSTWHVRA